MEGEDLYTMRNYLVKSADVHVGQNWGLQNTKLRPCVWLAFVVTWVFC